ncbi:SseB family protein [Nocardioides mangrovicus]|uniref:SseB family protein n=1 Tax=Nocardioides mangrovicus TaxID=2478913 RepID=UPI0013145580|nr:SseB family protein [Nocardioides mangrovicus]
MRTVLSATEFGDDDGAPDPRLVEALTVYREDPQGGYLPALAALSASRVVVPVVAQGEESTGVDMATVMMRRADGATALLSFSCLDHLTDWDAQARPLPTPVARAALAAMQEGCAALLVDHAGPVQLAVAGEDLEHLARGHRLVALDGGGWGWLQGS